MAKLIIGKKYTTSEGDIIEIKIWKFHKNTDFPQGIKYRLVYIHNNKRILGYDNERSKGDHKHYFDKEITYKFLDIKRLLEDFEVDIKMVREILHGNKES